MGGFLSRLPLIGRWFGPGKRDEAPVSLVMLTTGPTNVSMVEIGAAVREGLAGMETEMLGEMPAPSVAAGKVKGHMFFANGMLFGVAQASVPYIEDPGRMEMPALREDAERAMSNHRAWIAVDLFGPSPTLMAAYDVIGRVAARIMPSETCLLYMPRRSRFSFPNPRLIEAMGSGDWLGVFDDVATVPVVGRPKEDEALANAAREARMRLPEFFRAFDEGAGESHAVKVAFRSNGEGEHMWVMVREVTPSHIKGVLGSSPRFVTSVREGDQVSIKHDEIEDWMYTLAGEIKGGFSVRVLAPEMFAKG